MYTIRGQLALACMPGKTEEYRTAVAAQSTESSKQNASNDTESIPGFPNLKSSWNSSIKNKPNQNNIKNSPRADCEPAWILLFFSRPFHPCGTFQIQGASSLLVSPTL